MSVGRDTHTADAATAPCPLCEREHPDVRRAGEHGCRLGRILDDRQAGRLRRRLEGEARLHGNLVRRRETAQQLAELEVIEDSTCLLVVVACPARAVELELDRDVANDRHHPLAEPNLVCVRLQCGFEPAVGQLIDALQQGVHG